ncbi:MAG: isochorismate synthase MenF [Gemmatimonadota bacterium]
MYDLEAGPGAGAAIRETRGERGGEERVPGLAPETFLRAAASWPRGFWQRGDRWFAWAGSTARIQEPPGPQPEESRPGQREKRPSCGSEQESPSDPEAGRFEALRERAAALLAQPPRQDLSPLRFYGGISFTRSGTGRRSWRGFGSVDFVLPALEVEGGTAGGLLRAIPPAPGAEVAVHPGEIRERLARGVSEAPSSVPARLPKIEAIREPDTLSGWGAAVNRLLEAIRSGEVTKVVLARTLEVSLKEAPDPISLLRALRRSNPRGYVYYMEPEPGRVFLGAAPELLGELTGSRFHATAVAGTIRRGKDEAEDKALAGRLLTSAKERAEHRIGVSEMRERLARVANGARVDGAPRVVRLNRVQHLRTDLTLDLPEPSHILSLVGALHPTAAVCGYPRERAMRILLDEEPFDRGWYAAPVGWFDERGEGEFAPGLRSAVLQGDRGWLFAGAGIVEGSVPEREWEETRLKFGPMLQALGVSPTSW